MTRLPREIRDMIYEALLPSKVIMVNDVNDIDDFSYLYWHVPSQTKLNMCDYRFQLHVGTHSLPQHCLETEYIGEVMLYEIVATWDRTMIYALDVRTLPYLLSSKYWQHGRTATKVIRNLEIWVPIPDYQLCDLDHEHIPGPSGMHQDHPELIAALHHLFLLVTNTRVTILFRPVDSERRCFDVSKGLHIVSRAKKTYCKPMLDVLAAYAYKQGVEAVRTAGGAWRV
ncbi:hypothetical protein BKA63DRAFT_519260, partial [Paraphoma chrysanthemicola]